MYVIIAGAGKVGYRLAQTLIENRHEVTIIEKDPAKVAGLIREFGQSVMQGDAITVRALREAGANRADVVLATTELDEVNLVVCQVAKVVFLKPRTIALLRNLAYEGMFEGLGVDMVINTTRILNSYLSELVSTGDMLTPLLTLHGGGFELVQMEVGENSPAAHRKVSEITIPRDAILVAVQRGDLITIPHGEFVFEPDDVVVVLVAKGRGRELRQVL